MFKKTEKLKTCKFNVSTHTNNNIMIKMKTNNNKIPGRFGDTLRLFSSHFREGWKVESKRADI